MFKKLTSASFDNLLPDFSVAKRDLASVLDSLEYASVLKGFAKRKDIFVFGANNYRQAAFEADRTRYVDAWFHQWSVAEIAPEYLLSDFMRRDPEEVFSVCCNLAYDLFEKLTRRGVKEVAFIAVMTPAGDGLDHNAFTFKIVTGRQGVEEFGRVIGDQPQLILIAPES